MPIINSFFFFGPEYLHMIISIKLSMAEMYSILKNQKSKHGITFGAQTHTF
jgi:hypothetical protein